MLNQYLTKSKIFLSLEISLIFGIFLGKYFSINTNLEYYFILVISIILLIITFIFKEKAIKVFAICSIIIFASIYYYNFYKQKIIPKNIKYNQEIEAEALIINYPDVRDSKTKYTVEIKKVFRGDNNLQNYKILIETANFPEYKYGDLIRIKGKLEEPKNFDNFDYKAYLERYQVCAIIHNTNVENINKNNGNKVLSIIYNIKNKTTQNINKLLPEPEASLLNGLLLNVRQNIPKDLNDAFIATGTLHIIAISGSHIVIIVKFFQILTRRWPKNLAFLIGILGLITYSILTGLSASVIRASILSALLLSARQLGRIGNITLALFFTAFILILQNPLILNFDVGFQLSFAAVLGMIYLCPIFDKLLIKLPETMREIISATLAAQIATLPILLFSFGRLSLISPIPNLLILIFAPETLAASFVLVILSFISLPIATAFSYIVWLMLKYMIVIAQFFSKINFSSFTINYSNWKLVILYYFLLIITVIYFNKNNNYAERKTN